jgi:NOL1/NOP2/fmu family ribosome biogenesis protein
LLVANGAIRSRTNILAENLTKWGNPNVVITNNDPKDFSRLPDFFDAIFVDAPCSGEGMFRKDKKARDEWSEANVQLCAERQRRIVVDVWSALKPNGYLVYSTCTFNDKENEENVQWIMRELGAENVKIDVPKEWGVTFSEELQTETTRGVHSYRFFPHKVKGEGFFIAVLRKVVENNTTSLRERGTRTKQPQASRELTQWLHNPADFTFTQTDKFIKAFPSCLNACNNLLNKALRVIQSGVTLAEVKGRDCVPHHSLALSTALNVEAFPSIDLNLHTALLYLKKEAFASQSQSKGFELVRYNGLPLGFVKNLGNRCNNLFPQEWRIRMSVTPPQPS